MLIAIPSKGRAAACKSHRFLPGAVVYVPALEVDAYRACGVESVVGVPNDVLGITRTRNWILDHTDDPWVVMVDDDVKVAGWVRLDAHSMKHLKLRGEAFVSEFRKLFELIEDLDIRVWGTATDGAPRSVYPWNPFRFRSYVTASCMGLRNDTRVRFDESFRVKEDYELCLRCIKEDGAILSAQYLYWVNSHWGDTGGCADYRTQELERDAIARLMRMYPGLIRRVVRGGSEFSIQLDF
jgi:hypothetical protein